jgi:hypothetical protein
LVRPLSRSSAILVRGRLRTASEPRHAQKEDEQNCICWLKQTSSNDTTDGAPIKKHPLYRLYSPANPVLKEEYTILTLEEFKKIGNKEEEEVVKDKIKDWIEVGYHLHVAQAYKIEQSHGKLMIFLEKLKGRTLRDWIM